jgi:hypothetical protein
MPRAKKPRPTPDEPNAAAAESDEAAARPSQLDQIRAAMTQPSSSEKAMDELPAPEEPLELPAPEATAAPELVSHIEEPPAAPAAEAGESTVATEAAPEPEVASAPTAVAEPVTAPWVPPPTQPPAGMRPTAIAAVPARRGSSLALGIVLVVVGIFFLVMRLFNIDLSSYGWPLYVIIPGLTLLVVGFMSLGTGALIPGGVITMTGLVLAYQNSTGDWASWSYAWALVIPFGVGIGLFLQGLRIRDSKQLKQGRSLMFWGLMIFMIGFVLFESILNVSGIDYGIVGRAALPALLIIIGVTLLARSFQRGRSA